jgi:hypothetical protein
MRHRSSQNQPEVLFVLGIGLFDSHVINYLFDAVNVASDNRQGMLLLRILILPSYL